MYIYYIYVYLFICLFIYLYPLRLIRGNRFCRLAGSGTAGVPAEEYTIRIGSVSELLWGKWHLPAENGVITDQWHSVSRPSISHATVQ